MSAKSFIWGMCCIVLVTALFLACFVQAQVREEWITRYNGPATPPNDEAVAGIVDGLGNVYVTGKSPGPGSGMDYATVKYSPDGNELWVKRYNGLGNMDDVPIAIGIDALNNIYVLGISHGGAATEEDYLLLKYNPSGNLIWERRYDGPGNDVDSPDDNPTAMVVDAAGNVYVTGYSTGAGSEYDHTTLKYDTNGNLLWAARYDGPLTVTDYAAALTVDGSGNVYVTGKTPGSGTGYDIGTVKYDPNGNLLWARQYNGPADLADEPTLIEADASGNIYVTGISWDTGSIFHYVRLKYDSAGNLIWSRFFILPGDFAARDMTVDSLGNVYVTGDTIGVLTDPDIATLKYDSLGNKVWVKRYDFYYDHAYKLAVDDSGNVLVAGISEYPSPSAWPQYLTLKYDLNGNLLWERAEASGVRCHDIVIGYEGDIYVVGFSPNGVWMTSSYNLDFGTTKIDLNGNSLWHTQYNGPGSAQDNAVALSVDNAGNVYVTGWSEGLYGAKEFATAKYDHNGNQLWEVSYRAGSYSGDDCAVDIGVDDLGNLYVTGTSEGIGIDYATLKYAPDGTQLWERRHNGPGNGDDTPVGLVTDNAGNVYVTGKVHQSPTTQGFSTLKYDTYGNLLWERSFFDDGDEPAAIAIDGAGNVYVTGSSFGDYTTVKYDADGTMLWKRGYGVPGNIDNAVAIAVDDIGNVYVTGTTGGADPPSYLTVKYDSNGNLLWDRTLGGGVNSAKAIALDADGNVFVTGTSSDNYLTVKYDTNGLLQWTRRYDGPGTYDAASALALDRLGNIYVTGGSQGADMVSDYTTLKYSPAGALIWEIRYDGPGNGSASAIALDPLGGIYVTGTSWVSGDGSDYATVKYLEGDQFLVYMPDTIIVGPVALPGDTVSIGLYMNPFYYNNGSGIFSFEMGLTYDDSLYECVGYDSSGTVLANYGGLNPFTVEFRVAEGNAGAPDTVRLAGASDDSLYYSEVPGTPFAFPRPLVKLRFRLSETISSGTETMLNFTRFYFNEGIPGASTQDGCIGFWQRHYGDVNGDSHILPHDASLILRYVVGDTTLNEECQQAADVSGNGIVMAYDAALILMYYVGKITTFPASDYFKEALPSNRNAIVELIQNQLNDGAISVSIHGKNLSEVYAYSFELAYDPSLLTYQSIRESEFASGMLHVVSNENGIVRFAAAGAEAIDGEGKIAEIVFAVSGDVNDENLVQLTQVIVNEEIILSNASLISMPNTYSLEQNFPNPFNPETRIRFQIPEAAQVQLMIYNLLGQRVKTLVNEMRQAGVHDVIWDGTNDMGVKLASGLYIYRMTAGSYSSTRKLVMMK